MPVRLIQWSLNNRLLVAVGRQPELASLNLEAAGVRYSGRGLDTDRQHWRRAMQIIKGLDRE